MKKVILLLLCAICVSLPLCAQNQKGKHRHGRPSHKELMEFKLKFLAQEMELKGDQKEKFAATYTSMMDEKKKVFSEIKGLEKKINENENATEEEYEAVSEAISNAKVRDAEIERRYDEKFSKFLSRKQIFKMKSAEEKFREKMNQMRHKRRHLPAVKEKDKK